MFHAEKLFPGITHITDQMGVCFTLIEGSTKALLFDTGYGTENVDAYVRSLTDKPLTVLLSHGHHDHILGARWFKNTFMCQEDLDEFRERTGDAQRRKVMKQAEERGVSVPDDFMSAPITLPAPVRFTHRINGFECKQISLGGLSAQMVKVPGHTPGSLVVYVPEYRLLLTGDNWNPCTWMWFPSSLSAREWRNNMLSVIGWLERRNGKWIDNVICPHQPGVHKGEEIKDFLTYMDDKRMTEAPAADMGTTINTHQITEKGNGWILVFDRDKI